MIESWALLAVSRPAVRVGTRQHCSNADHYCTDSGSKWHHQRKIAGPRIRDILALVLYSGRKLSHGIHLLFISMAGTDKQTEQTTQ